MVAKHNRVRFQESYAPPEIERRRISKDQTQARLTADISNSNIIANAVKQVDFGVQIQPQDTRSKAEIMGDNIAQSNRLMSNLKTLFGRDAESIQDAWSSIQSSPDEVLFVNSHWSDIVQGLTKTRGADYLDSSDFLNYINVYNTTLTDREYGVMPNKLPAQIGKQKKAIDADADLQAGMECVDTKKTLSQFGPVIGVFADAVFGIPQSITDDSKTRTINLINKKCKTLYDVVYHIDDDSFLAKNFQKFTSILDSRIPDIVDLKIYSIDKVKRLGKITPEHIQDEINKFVENDEDARQKAREADAIAMSQLSAKLQDDYNKKMKRPSLSAIQSSRLKPAASPARPPPRKYDIISDGTDKYVIDLTTNKIYEGDKYKSNGTHGKIGDIKVSTRTGEPRLASTAEIGEFDPVSGTISFLKAPAPTITSFFPPAAAAPPPPTSSSRPSSPMTGTGLRRRKRVKRQRRTVYRY